MSEIFPFSPSDLGLPPKFQEFRADQERMILAALDSPKRYIIYNAPVGSGKSLGYYTVGAMQDIRWAVCTATRGLQNQLLDDFSPCGLVDMRGRGNFPCRSGKHRATCEEGAKAGCNWKRLEGCPYWKQYQRALRSPRFTTNYACWCLTHLYSEGLGPVDLLVCDEAHSAPEEVIRAAGVTIEPMEVYRILNTDWPRPMNTHWPNTSAERSEKSVNDVYYWRQWAERHAPGLASRVRLIEDRMKEGNVSDEDMERLGIYRTLHSKLEAILSAPQGAWAWEPCRLAGNSLGARIEPIRASDYAQRYLFMSIPKIIICSATVNMKTLDLLGIPEADCEMLHIRSTFPANRWPFISFKNSVKMKRDVEPPEKLRWLSEIDSILSARADRKGIVHCHSYELGKYIASHSSHQGRFIAHTDASGTAEAVQLYRESKHPVVLISPSVTTGYDFPGSSCEFQIIAKVPFPSKASILTETRMELDRDYYNYLTAQTLAQISGRGMRSPEDRCETFIVDGQYTWVRSACAPFFPLWYKSIQKSLPRIPGKPPKIEESPAVVPVTSIGADGIPETYMVPAAGVKGLNRPAFMNTPTPVAGIDDEDDIPF